AGNDLSHASVEQKDIGREPRQATFVEAPQHGILEVGGEQIEQAVQGKDYKKFDELAQKLPELEKKLGPEYLGLLESLRSVNLTSRDGRESVSMFDPLGESCPH